MLNIVGGTPGTNAAEPEAGSGIDSLGIIDEGRYGVEIAPTDASRNYYELRLDFSDAIIFIEAKPEENHALVLSYRQPELEEEYHDRVPIHNPSENSYKFTPFTFMPGEVFEYRFEALDAHGEKVGEQSILVNAVDLSLPGYVPDSTSQTDSGREILYPE